MLTQARLKELLHYDPDTGVFTWLVSSGSRKIGDVAGTLSPKGYIFIGLGGKCYRAQRVVYLYMTGEIPELLVDHINNNKIDNRWCNLRHASHQENSFNRVINKNNTSGYKGVFWHKRDLNWRVAISSGGKRTWLGTFDCKHEAAKAYNKKALELHGEFACLNEIIR